MHLRPLKVVEAEATLMTELAKTVPLRLIRPA